MKPDFPRSIDSSMRKAFVSCPMKFYRTYVQHYKPKLPSVHLHFGGAFAFGLENTRKAFYGEGQSADEALATGLTALLTFWGDKEFDHKYKTLEACILALYEYFIEYPLEADYVQPLQTANGPAIEWSFAIPLDLKHPQTKEPLLYTGRFDMLGTYGGVPYVVDEKTAGSLGTQWARNYKLASQVTGYCWAARKYGHNVSGAIFRGVAPLVSGTSFLQVITQRPNWMIERWEEQILRDIKRMIRCWEEDNWDMTLDGACNEYGGCPLMDVCSSHNPEPWLETAFEVNVWDPLAKFEEATK